MHARQACTGLDARCRLYHAQARSPASTAGLMRVGDQASRRLGRFQMRA